jgi:hypothetical protein
MISCACLYRLCQAVKRILKTAAFIIRGKYSNGLMEG